MSVLFGMSRGILPGRSFRSRRVLGRAPRAVGEGLAPPAPTCDGRRREAGGPRGAPTPPMTTAGPAAPDRRSPNLPADRAGLSGSPAPPPPRDALARRAPGRRRVPADAAELV